MAHRNSGTFRGMKPPFVLKDESRDLKENTQSLERSQSKASAIKSINRTRSV
jgi:hypothetical protein